MSTLHHHRGSIFWALTLIGIGVLFLYQNFNSDVRPWHLIAKYWPLLVIFWGLSKLVDYFYARAHPGDATHSLFSAGELVLLIVILAMGTLLSRALLKPWGGWPGIMDMGNQQFAEMFFNSYTFTQSVSQDVKGNQRILLVNRRGDVDIQGSEQSSIGAVIRETIWAENESAARKIADRLKFHISENDGQYELGSNRDSLPSAGQTMRLDMSIRVPKSTTAEVTDDDGDVNLSDLKGDQTLTSRHGDVNATNIKGSIRVHQSGGSASVQNIDGSVGIEGRGGDIGVRGVTGSVTIDGNFSGATQFENIAQTLRYQSSRTTLTLQKLTGSLLMDMGNLAVSDVGGPFELTTRDKDISLENFADNVKIIDTNGDVRIQTATPPTQPIDVQVKKGDITLSLPATSNFQIDAVSHNGDVSCDFPGLKVSREPQLPSVTGVYGENGPLIRLSSTYGAIRLIRAQPRHLSSPATTASNRVISGGLQVHLDRF
jgi:DUF4097 and DUF4098 domain-containing protein YvlB